MGRGGDGEDGRTLDGAARATVAVDGLKVGVLTRR
jgi:hypothetical protein